MTAQLSKKSEAWSARFSEPVSDLVKRYTASVFFDYRLAEFDIQGSLAHAEMLAYQNIISQQDYADIQRGMAQIQSEIAAGQFEWLLDLEDVHLNIEKRLTELVGDAGKRLHTGRSRNDQVATDFRLWVRNATQEIDAGLRAFQLALVTRADEHVGSIMPGFTHLQVAQPVTLGHHLMAYYEMAKRDRSRFADCRSRLNHSPLGAAALAGTSFPIDRAATAAALGFDGPMGNSLDAVSDRDFALEFLTAAAQTALHLSRLAEEMILWASQPFGFIALPDAWSTGSSIMPQKRNPDAAELVRGHAGRILGCMNSLMITMKGLPLAYSKDMQDDKPPVFEAYDLLALSIAAMTGMVANVTFNTARMREVAETGFSTATDLADWLVRAFAMPFREAHHVTGSIVKACEARGISLSDINADDLAAINPVLAGCTLPDLSIDGSVASRTSVGGTAPVRVKEAIAAAKKELAA